MTYEQAVLNQWTIAYHRIKAAEENTKAGRMASCKCADCREHMEAIAKGPQNSALAGAE
jgi:hypothetical protein